MTKRNLVYIAGYILGIAFLLLGAVFYRQALLSILILLMIQSVRAAKIGNPALGGNACASEKDDVMRPVNHGLQR